MPLNRQSWKQDKKWFSSTFSFVDAQAHLMNNFET